MYELLDEVRIELSQEPPKQYPYAEWEKKRKMIKEKLRDLPKTIERSVKMLHIPKSVGRPKALDLETRTLLFLFSRMLEKSNRFMEDIVVFFQPLFGFQVSYKTIERLYSDEEVKLVLWNLHSILIEESQPENLSGDGTGYSISIKNHYRSDPKKKAKKFRYVFRIIDLDSGMYIAYGYSHKSEMDAFKKAMKMLLMLNVIPNSIRLDKYYSSRKIIRMFDEKTTIFLIPKKNTRKFGNEWARIINRCLMDPLEYANQYYKRNLSESGFSADKRRFGWHIRQIREDRRENALFTIGILHNIFSVRMKPG